MAIETLYQEILREHYQNPRNRGLLAQHNRASGVVNPSCGDSVSVQTLLDGDRLTSIGYTGEGCMLSQAMSSLWSEYVLTIPVSEIIALQPQDCVRIFKLEFGPTRARCAFLFIEALQKALA